MSIPPNERPRDYVYFTTLGQQPFSEEVIESIKHHISECYSIEGGVDAISLDIVQLTDGSGCLCYTEADSWSNIEWFLQLRDVLSGSMIVNTIRRAIPGSRAARYYLPPVEAWKNPMVYTSVIHHHYKKVVNDLGL